MMENKQKILFLKNEGTSKVQRMVIFNHLLKKVMEK